MIGSNYKIIYKNNLKNKMKRKIFVSLSLTLIFLIGVVIFVVKDNSSFFSTNCVLENPKRNREIIAMQRIIPVKDKKNNSLLNKNGRNKVDIDSLKKSSWFNIISEKIKAEEYNLAFDKKEKNFSSPNRKQNLMFTYFKNGFSVKPLLIKTPLFDPNDKNIDDKNKKYKYTNNWNIGIFLTDYGRENLTIPFIGSKFYKNKNMGTVSDGNMKIEYNNTPKGMRQDFILNRKTGGEGNLLLSFKIKTKLQFSVDGNNIKFYNSRNKTEMSYSDLKIYDKIGRNIEGQFVKLNDNTIQICVIDNNAEYPLRIDPLSSTPDWTHTGQTDSEIFGFSIASAGDVNKDGYGDVIISADNHSSSKGSGGKVYVYYGSPSGLPTDRSWTKGSENNNFDQFGWSVSTAGDVNGDGYSDIVVSAVNYESAKGKVYVFYGHSNGLSSNADWTQTRKTIRMSMVFRFQQLVMSTVMDLVI